MTSTLANIIRRCIIGALLGAFFGFTGQFCADMTRHIDITHLSWTPAAFVSVQSDVPRLFSDGPPYYWAYSPDGRDFGTPYFNANGKPAVPDGAKDFTVPASQKLRWRQLWYQLLFLNWLQENGEIAGRTATCTALFVALLVFALGRLRRRGKVTSGTS